MIAVDTSVLVHSHRNDTPFCAQAFAAVAGLAESGVARAISSPCLHEFFNIATYPRIYRPPSTLAQMSRQIDVWMASPNILLLHALSVRDFKRFQSLRVRNPLVA